MIKLIFHLSDIHIRTYQMHDLYKNQFDRLITSISEQIVGLKHHEVRIVITGDIYHQKISISNEQVLLTAWFFDELSKLGVLIILPGNHDFLENNTERMDSITPIIDLLKNPNIHYYKDMGTYDDNNVTWVVYSLYQHNQRPVYDVDPGQFYVGLFHSPIQGLSTDLGFKFDDDYDVLNFVGIDLLLCGDIHKRQVFKLPNDKTGVMIGSLIQQGHGETIKHHGYGIYDFEDKKYSFVDLENDQPFMHFKITDFTDIENDREELLNLG